MALEALAEVVADFQQELSGVADATASAVQGEVVRLMEAPQDRNAAILSDFAASGEQQTIRETGNAELARVLWDEIAELATMRMSDLMLMPPADRGLVWTAAASLLLATCQRQAWITHGGAIDALRVGVLSAVELRKATRGMSPDTLRTANFPVKSAIRARNVAGQNG